MMMLTRLFFPPSQAKFPEPTVTPYPDWVFAVIVLLSAIPVAPIPLVALYRLICCGLKGRRRRPSEPANQPQPTLH